jgi:mitochondrial fission protein ELM1
VTPAAPRTWLLLAEKQGDNAQVEALAEALPWACEVRRVAMKRRWLKGKPRVRASLSHLDLSASDALEPPWPDLVITNGRRTGNVALWIRKQSGGRTKLVMVGKPSGRVTRWDLVIGSAEAQIPPEDNLALIGLPLLRVDPAAVAKEADAWRAEMADWPRPLLAILVGGPTGPFVYDRSVRERLVSMVHSIREGGGTPYVTTSRRTPARVADAIEASLPQGAHLYRWRPDGERNPYRALLGLADGFAVTGDSISMLVEVARLKRPLAIIGLPTGRLLGGIDQRRRRLLSRLFVPPRADGSDGGRVRLARIVGRIPLLTQTRDFDAFHGWMVSSGLASWATEEVPPEGWPPPAPDSDSGDDLDRAAAAVVRLWEQHTD